jgi:exopolysaccharide biosynthesis polyprenyl glycosylphosphotransferase
VGIVGFRFGTDARMESMTATSADHEGTLTVPAAVHASLYVPSARATERSAELRRLLGTADVVAGALAGVAAGLLSFAAPSEVALVGLLLALAWPLLAFACGLYAAADLRSWASGVSEAPKLVLAALLLSWPLYGLLAALDAPQPIPASLAGSVAVAAAAGLARAAARMFAHRSAALRQRTLVIGSGLVADQLVQRLYRHEELGLEPIGFLDADADNYGELGLPSLGGLDALPVLLDSGRVDRVMIAFSRAGHEELLACLRACRDAGVAVDVVPRLFEFLDGARTVDQIGGMPLLSITAPTFSRSSEIAKRGLDIVGSLLMLLSLAPILLVVAVAIKLDSRGPVLFKQRRSGRGGTFFSLYKFRSMHNGATVEVREDGAIVKSEDDQRITRVGRFIRRFSLDEAPQLFNVLRGEMSLVGPRPLVEAEAAVLRDWQERRADLRPGLTGPWQIAGRSHIPFHEMVKFDYQYVAGWSLARDVEILLATVPVVLAGRGAY